MQTVVDLIITSGETGVDLALYLLLPVLVVLMALMRVLEDKGILAFIAEKLSPVLVIFGLPGLGVFAMIQILFVNFAAPISTFKIMEQDGKISNRKVAATLGAVLVMSQANAAFPLAVVGLNIQVAILTSVLGGLLAGFLAYKIHGEDDEESFKQVAKNIEVEEDKEDLKLIPLLFKGGAEGLEIVKKSIPPLILAIFLVNVLREVGAIAVLETIMAPALTRIGIPGAAVLPIATKYLAGGTAMLGILLDLMREEVMTVAELNRVAGFTLNPFDPVGLALLISAGPRVKQVARPAMAAAVIGVIFRGILHLIIF
ncbi:MAG: nucleoside recognition domain-containing protein [Halanaerobiaceae bacterium]